MSTNSYRVIAFVLVSMLLGQLTGAQQAVNLKLVSDRLSASIQTGGRSLEFARKLSDGFGGRLTGSPAYQKAAEWAAAQFRSFGISNVRLEPFTMEHGWERGFAQARMLAPLERPLHLEAFGWTMATPPEGVKGRVVAVSDVSANSLKSQAETIKGQIVLLVLGSVFGGGPEASYADYTASFQRLKDIGAQAVLIARGNDPNNILSASNTPLMNQVPALPVAQLGMEDGQLITRLMKDGPVTVEFNYQNKLTGPIQVNNVIAEIPGREKPDEWIIIGGHLDSWDYGTGTQDNGTGVAMVLEAGRAIAQLGQAPRRSIRFALWGGEEQGLFGSLAYVRAHSAEMGKCMAVLNTDDGAGAPKGWISPGRTDVSAGLQEISKSLLAGLHGDGMTQDTTYALDSDHGPFILQGIPALDLWVEDSHYEDIHHKVSDTFDKIDPKNLAADTAIVAITAFAVAERPGPIAPRLDHAAVRDLIRKAGLEFSLKVMDVSEFKL